MRTNGRRAGASCLRSIGPLVTNPNPNPNPNQVPAASAPLGHLLLTLTLTLTLTRCQLPPLDRATVCRRLSGSRVLLVGDSVLQQVELLLTRSSSLLGAPSYY